MQNHEQALLSVTINASSGQTSGVVPLVCASGQPVYVRNHISTGAFNPGTSTNLTVVVHNLSNTPMIGAMCHLIPLTPFVQASVATAPFGDIAPGCSTRIKAQAFALAPAFWRSGACRLR